MKYLKHCCLCCSLGTGVSVIATIGGIFSLLRLIFGLGSFIIAQLDTWKPISYYSYDDYMTHRLRKDIYYFSRLCMFPISVKIIHAIISLIANILLILTVLKKQRYYLLPWLIISLLDNLLISLAVVIGLGIMTYIIEIHLDFKEVMWIYLLIILFVSGVWWYAWVIVYSYFEELRLKQRHRDENNVKELDKETKIKSPVLPHLNNEEKTAFPLLITDYQYYFKDEALV